MPKRILHYTTIAHAKRELNLSYLGGVAISAKMSHSMEFSHQYTYAIYLAPAKTSGFNVCSHSTPECRLGCLNTSGRAAIDIFTGNTRIQDARIKKTRLFHEHPDFFMAWMIAEIRSNQAKAKKDGFFFSVRLNATSDIDWSHVYYKGRNIFEIFPEVAFYDYTKNHNKFNNIAENYHLTLSYTGRNWDKCLDVLAKGHNVAMVFNVRNEKFLPETYKGFKVINGDLTDYRAADPIGIIVGLKWKRIANRENEKKVLNSVFVVTLDKDHAIKTKI
jgi:hypothetical protein